MRRASSYLTVAGAVTLLLVGSAAAQTTFQFASDLPDIELKVVGGAKAGTKDWPSTLVFKNEEGQGCSATAVGPRVILTAAHCLPNGASGVIDAGGDKITVRCRHHDDYPFNIVADFALCFASMALPVPPGGFETLDDDKTPRPARGEKVTLLGYGCTTPGGDRNFGVLFGGQATVRQSHDAIGYVQTTDGAALCYGDSGGAAYRFLDSGRRRIFGVNSRGDLSTTSWLSPTAWPAFVEWAKAWAADRSKENQDVRVDLCGIMPGAPNCRL